METIFKETGSESLPLHFPEFLNALTSAPQFGGPKALVQGMDSGAAAANTKLARASILVQWRTGGGTAGNVHPRGETVGPQTSRSQPQRCPPGKGRRR